MRQFADLEIRILPLEDEGFPIELTVDGQRQYARGYAAGDFLPWTPTPAPEEDGRRLFAWLFGDAALRTAWAEVRGAHPQRRIRLRIDAEAPQLHALPWEMMRAPEDDTNLPLAAGSSTPFSRYLAGPWDPGAAIPRRPIKIAVAVAAPENLAEYGLAPIDAAAEWQALQAALAGVDAEFVLVSQPCTLAALEATVQDGCHILHFIGHGAFGRGSDDAVLYLADESNQVRPVREQELAAMLARRLVDTDDAPADAAGNSTGIPGGGQLRLVFLAACQSATRSPADAFRGLAPSLVAAGVPAVVAMQDLVAVETAQAFSAAFYRQLMRHGLVDLACNEARAAILTRSLPGAAVPVLFMRLEQGVLLDMPAPAGPGGWSVPFWLAAALVGVVIVATAIGLSVSSWFAPEPPPPPDTPTPAPPTSTPTPVPMGGTFNVAVARFGELDASGAAIPSAAGATYSQWIFSALQAEFASSQELLGQGNLVEVWLAPSDFGADGVASGVILGKSEEDRAESAHHLASELHADMLIFGNLAADVEGSAAAGGASKQLEFELFIEPAFGEEIQQIAGHHTLGAGVAVAANPAGLNKVAIARLLESRAETLAGVTVGLILDLLGDHARALDVFTTLTGDPGQVADPALAQLLYSFIGRQQLFLGRDDEAEAALNQALAADPNSPRAHVVLGSVFLKRAGERMAADGSPAPELTAEALRHYQLAVENAAGDMLLEQSSRLALGSAFVVAGQSAYLGDDLVQARDLLGRGLGELEGVTPALEQAGLVRYLAQARQFEGNAYFLLSDIARLEDDAAARRSRLQEASVAYQQCIDQGELAPADATLSEQIIAGVCRPYLQQVAQTLEKLK